MGTQLVPVQSLQEALNVSHLHQYMRQYPNGQHACICAKLKTRSEVAAPFKGHTRLNIHEGVWQSLSKPLSPRQHLLLACGSAPGPASWVWHLCWTGKRDGLVLGSCAGGNYWLNVRHDMGNPTDLKRIWARSELQPSDYAPASMPGCSH